MKINIKYKKPYGARYDCYYNNVKVNRRKKIDLPDAGTLLLVEQSLFLYRVWWLIATFVIVLGLIGSYGEDWKNERQKQRTIAVNYKNIISDDLTFEVSNQGHTIVLQGVKESSIDSITEDVSPLIRKRIKIARGIAIATPLTILAIIVVFLAISLM